MRFKATDHDGNVRYLIVRLDTISLVNKHNVSLALSFITDNAAELRFALEDALHSAQDHVDRIIRVLNTRAPMKTPWEKL
jgi:hypothetical protein